jgi:hypothetical protein
VGPSIGGKSRLTGRRQSINPPLNHLTEAVGGELLEDVPDFPFTGGNPVPIRCFIHGQQRFIQRLLASLGQLTLQDFLVHSGLMKNVPPSPS